MGPPPRVWNPAFARLWGATFSVYFSFYLLLPVLPVYALSLGIGESAIGLIIGIFALTAMILKPGTGWVMDWHGRRGILTAGAALFGLASLLYPATRSTASLLLVRVVHGAGMGLFPTAGVAVVADLAPVERRGEAMGLFGMAANLAMAIGPTLGVSMEGRLGFLGLCLISAALAGLGVGLTLLVPETGLLGARPPFRAGQLLAPQTLRPAAVTLALFLPYGALVSFLPLLTQARGAGNPGLFFTLMAIALLAVRAQAGQLSDRIGRRAVVAPAAVVIAASLAVLAMARAPWTIYGAGFLFGLGLGSAQPTLMAWAADLVAPVDRGKAMATFYTAWELGIGGGSILFGLLLPLGGFEALFATGAAIALAAGALALCRSPRGTRAGAG
ncbi:MAG: MFS transporter [Candidatus Rokubacteria bacterium]|nr:MFS transporter [Candidatus Rokubacteria bacterium]